MEIFKIYSTELLNSITPVILCHIVYDQYDRTESIVRDVAEAHIRAAELDKAKGRHILVNESKRFIELAEILKKQFPQYKLPKSNLPKFLLYIVGPFLGFSWKFINRNVGVPLYFDNSWTKTNLDMDFIPLEQTMTEMVESMQEHGHI